ncbi:hypothetical protein AURDEDRAFT_161744 [Auricularia subglabra TFB-10046 SS5]|nr:hypothetical protein AURDEDRAFT_161744 [Auricularia subglabra TFB-10046 SS5]
MADPMSSSLATPSRAAAAAPALRLPFDLLCYTMAFMRPPALQNFARTNRAFRAEYRASRHRLYDLMGMLSYYFPNPIDFRILQSRTSLIIAGSFALQFLGRVTFGITDLDLYVSQFAVYVVIDWLLTQGYRLLPRARNDLSLADGLVMPRLRALAIRAGLYIGTGQVVFKFTNSLGRSIDLIVNETSAFSGLLHFHSTAVLNLVSTDWAISLVPWATYAEKTSLMLRPLTPRLRLIVEKYEERGFTVVEHARGSSLFADGERWIHDAMFSDLLALARGADLHRLVSRHAPWMFRLPTVPDPAPGSFFFTREYALLPYQCHLRRDDTAYWRRIGWRFVTTEKGTSIVSSTLFYDATETYTIPDGFSNFALTTTGWMGDIPDGARLDVWIQLYRLSLLPLFR